MVLLAAQLATKVRRNLSTIQAGVARGLNSRQINSLIEGATGSGVRRVDLLAGIRHLRGQAEAALHIRNIRRDRLPDPARLPRARTRILSNFSFVVEVRGIDSDTGLATTRRLTIRSDRLLTPREIEEEALNAIDEAQADTTSDLPFEPVQVVVISGRRR